MTKTELLELGLTPDDVLNRLVDRLQDSYVNKDEEGIATDFDQRMQKAVKMRIDEVLNGAMEKHILPMVSKQVEEICLQETNSWGEPKGVKVTFIEYLTQRVDSYIREPVNYQGKSKGEDSYSWTKSSTRIAHMIHEHLHYAISTAMTNALSTVNSSVRKGLEEAVKISLANIKVSVDTKVIDR